MPVLPVRRRDPWWEVDGPAARRERRRRRALETAAFLTALVAATLSAGAWALQFGAGQLLGLSLDRLVG